MNRKHESVSLSGNVNVSDELDGFCVCENFRAWEKDDPDTEKGNILYSSCTRFLGVLSQ